MGVGYKISRNLDKSDNRNTNLYDNNEGFKYPLNEYSKRCSRTDLDTLITQSDWKSVSQYIAKEKTDQTLVKQTETYNETDDDSDELFEKFQIKYRYNHKPSISL